MSMMSSVRELVPSLETRGNLIRDSWDRLSRVPGGRTLFSRLVGRAAPYTATMGARVTELGRGRARTEMTDRKKVRNHLDCVHAIALANLAELTGNIAVAYTLPDDARFIVAGMNIEYVQKARGTIHGYAECPLFETNERVEVPIEVTLTNDRGEVVTKVVLQTLIGPKKRA